MIQAIKNIKSFTEIDAYAELFENAFHTTGFDKEEKIIFFYYRDLIIDGLKYARINKLHYSGHLLRQCEGFMTLNTTNCIVLKQILHNIYLPAKSYYYYKIKKVSIAKTLLFRTLFIDKQLEKSGWHFLVFNRVQQYHNLVRIYLYTGDYSKAKFMVSKIITYLIGRILPNERSINDLLLDKGSYNYYKLRNLMVNQLLNETCDFFIRIGFETFIEFCKPIAEEILLYRNGFKCYISEDSNLLEKITFFTDFFFDRNRFASNSIITDIEENNIAVSNWIRQLKNIHGQNDERLIPN